MLDKNNKLIEFILNISVIWINVMRITQLLNKIDFLIKSHLKIQLFAVYKRHTQNKSIQKWKRKGQERCFKKMEMERIRRYHVNFTQNGIQVKKHKDGHFVRIMDITHSDI